MHQAKPILFAAGSSRVEPPVPPLYHWLGAEAETAAQSKASAPGGLSLYHWLGADAEAVAAETRH